MQTTRTVERAIAVKAMRVVVVGKLRRDFMEVLGSETNTSSISIAAKLGRRQDLRQGINRDYLRQQCHAVYDNLKKERRFRRSPF